VTESRSIDPWYGQRGIWRRLSSGDFQTWRWKAAGRVGTAEAQTNRRENGVPVGLFQFYTRP